MTPSKECGKLIIYDTFNNKTENNEKSFFFSLTTVVGVI